MPSTHRIPTTPSFSANSETSSSQSSKYTSPTDQVLQKSPTGTTTARSRTHRPTTTPGKGVTSPGSNTTTTTSTPPLELASDSQIPSPQSPPGSSVLTPAADISGSHSSPAVTPTQLIMPSQTPRSGSQGAMAVSELQSAPSTTVSTPQNVVSSEHAKHNAFQSDTTNGSTHTSIHNRTYANPQPQPHTSPKGDYIILAAGNSQSLTRNHTLLPTTTTLRHHITPSPVPVPQPPPVARPSIRPMTNAEYLSGRLLPVLLCTVLTALIQVLSSSARSVFPFAVLTRPPRGNGEDGAKAQDSVLLRLGGIYGPVTSLRLLFQIREPLPFLFDLLVLLSVVLTTISTSTVTIGYFGFCDTGSHDGWCYMGVGY